MRNDGIPFLGDIKQAQLSTDTRLRDTISSCSGGISGNYLSNRVKEVSLHMRRGDFDEDGQIKSSKQVVCTSCRW